ncbi:iron-containing alcohol dehydrogenase [Pseudomaricurvus alkylphenolicus]|jgi:alcohol dehydrogenase|uniref:iron-containing alcohol dehydrogenase n=1 Tax=Pseudomaricurvus alkylphenolicus TaxID=1306991 RepID=UPI00142171D9|nr:iron-containing alcohol dehydrogenase [Pseudomaricurvus alkylphenolicus]NIB44950.1 iron-containing alcohol dehydrogenase [Pseudomaricurvus alkylphenolicus]
MQPFTFTTTRSLVSRPGALKELPDYCRQLGMERPLIVTDRGIVSAGLLDQLEDVLGQLPSDSYCDVVADPPESVVLEALAKAQSMQADGIIGFGGGSSMDTAKLIALLACSGESLDQVYGVEQAKGPRLPLVLIPTTAGTGSEVTAVAIVTTGETTKTGVVSPILLPDLAILDAELTVGLPGHITAATGIDAMVHAIEAYTSAHKKNPYSDMLAREALKLMAGSLLTAVENGEDLEARQQMLLGACLAGQAFANAPVAAVHALAYPLGGHYHIPHGLSNSLVLPEVLRFNASAAADLYAELYDVLVPSNDYATADQKTQAMIQWLKQLIDSVGLPTRLRDAGVKEKSLEILAADAMLQQRLLVNNPREVSEADALAIYRAVF